MKKVINKVLWWIFVVLCISVGLYPIIYFVIDRHFGLLATKSQQLLSANLWNFGFYGHIVFGGIALLIGWTQFSSVLRKKRMNLHRAIGKIYGRNISGDNDSISSSTTHLRKKKLGPTKQFGLAYYLGSVLTMVFQSTMERFIM